jgi:UDP-N-acetylmuramoyl-L-alanyl-D-glutamate--2,6-diaminopimelate ligase
MGRVAAEGAAAIIVTDDNPRGEDPQAIVAAIMQGIQAAGASARARLIHDRARAISSALEQASAGDVVLVAGKGHEPFQIVGRVRRAFDDASAVRAALALWRAPGRCA